MEMLPFDEAIAWAKARKVVLPDVYYGQLQGMARANAYSVAGLVDLAQIQMVLDSLVEATANGSSFAEWAEKVKSGEIGLDLPQHRLENIFRTNIQGHYSRGRCEQQAATVGAFPYYMYDAVNDSRTRVAHAAMDGFVAPADDPVWDTWTPPNGYQCRCKRIALTRQQAKRFMNADNNRMNTDIDAMMGRIDSLSDGPDTGWDYNIGKDATAGLKKAVKDQEKLIKSLDIPQDKIPAPTMPWHNSEVGEDWQKWHDAAFTESSDAVRELVAKSTVKLGKVTTNNPGAYAQGLDINMEAARFDPSDLSAQGTWRHEFGHALDRRESMDLGMPEPYWSSNANFKHAMEVDGKELGDRVYLSKADKAKFTRELNEIGGLIGDKVSEEEFAKKMSAKFKKIGMNRTEVINGLDRQTLRRQEVLLEQRKQEMNFYLGLKYRMGQRVLDAIELGDQYATYHHSGVASKLSDLMDALTYQKISGCGAHSKEYYDKGAHLRPTECFADMLSLLGDANKVWRNVLERLVPTLFNYVTDKWHI